MKDIEPFSRNDALETALAFCRAIRDTGFIGRMEIAGSIRRGSPTVHDIDILIADASARTAVFVMSYASAPHIISSGEDKISMFVRCAGRMIQMDIRFIAGESWGPALQYFTGSWEHNVSLRRIAKELGMRLSEYGLFRGDVRVDDGTEPSVYQHLGLRWLPPRYRNGYIGAQKTNAPRPTWCVDHVVYDYCRRTRLLKKMGGRDAA